MDKLNKISEKLTIMVGTPTSVLFHTIFFIGIFALVAFGVGVDEILLILTTAVSLEAIYLAIFIQMTVNKNSANLIEVKEDIDEIQEDVDEIQDDVDEIQEDVDDIQEDVEDDDEEDKKILKLLTSIQKDLNSLKLDVEKLKK